MNNKFNLITTSITLLALLSLTPSVQAQAQSGTTVINGHVYNAANNNAPVSGATVNVTCNGQAPIQGNPLTTNASGKFTGTYSESVCGENDIVYASASKGGLSGNGQDDVNQLSESLPNIYIADPDVFLNVPEFGFATGALAVISSLGAYAGLRFSRKAK